MSDKDKLSNTQATFVPQSETAFNHSAIKENEELKSET
jgi:hypothetical protein